MEFETLKKIRRIIMEIVFVIAMVFLLSYTFFAKQLMQGFSMEQTIHDKNVVLINRLYRKLLPIRRYDIVALTINNQKTIRRVIGLPGDTIKVLSGDIFINDEILDEEFAKTALSSNVDQVRKVEENEFYVIGDNLDSSIDSRFEEVGNINRDYIIGKVWFIIK